MNTSLLNPSFDLPHYQQNEKQIYIITNREIQDKDPKPIQQIFTDRDSSMIQEGQQRIFFQIEGRKTFTAIRRDTPTREFLHFLAVDLLFPFCHYCDPADVFQSILIECLFPYRFPDKLNFATCDKAVCSYLDLQKRAMDDFSKIAPSYPECNWEELRFALNTYSREAGE